MVCQNPKHSRSHFPWSRFSIITAVTPKIFGEGLQVLKGHKDKVHCQPHTSPEDTGLGVKKVGFGVQKTGFESWGHHAMSKRHLLKRLIS